MDVHQSVYVAGQLQSQVSGYDYITLKYDSFGRQKWVQLYNGPSNGADIAKALAVAPDGAIYVSGTSATSNGGRDIVTIKYVEYEPVTLTTNGLAHVEFYSTNLPPCRIQASSDLSVWDDLAAVMPVVDSIVRFTDTNAPAWSQRFYRIACP